MTKRATSRSCPWSRAPCAASHRGITHLTAASTWWGTAPLISGGDGHCKYLIPSGSWEAPEQLHLSRHHPTSPAHLRAAGTAEGPTEISPPERDPCWPCPNAVQPSGHDKYQAMRKIKQKTSAQPIKSQGKLAGVSGTT